MKIIKITDDEIIFDNDMTISQDHDQDCCEEVYADFKQLHDTFIMTERFNNGVFVSPHKFGFVIYGDSEYSYYVPCYNIQNGYYSDDLTITFPSKNKKGKWNYQTINIVDKIEEAI